MTAPSELRFEFGDNWAKFLKVVDDVRIGLAEQSVQALVGRERLDGLTFLDIGSGSGLSGLAACRLGATSSTGSVGTHSKLPSRKRFSPSVCASVSASQS